MVGARARAAWRPGAREAGPRPWPGREMRGRETEGKPVLELLDAAAAGGAGTLLVEGDPGTGKSMLRAEALGAARDLGLQTAGGRCVALGQGRPLQPLLNAFGPSAAAGPAFPDPVEGLGRAIAERARGGPLLIGLDDLQWADSATLAAICALRESLAAAPVSWLLLRRPVPGPSALLFDLLEDEGAVRTVLGPLDGEAQRAMMFDAFGAPPGRRLRALAGTAEGNPFLLAELLAGLREDGTVRLVDGLARPEPAGLPRRALDAARRRFAHLSGPTRRLVGVAVVLGRTFRCADACAVLGESPASLLPSVQEAMAAGVLAASGGELAFRNELVWRAATGSVPVAVRRALHQQAADVLLDRGHRWPDVAGHLALGAQRGDDRALARLDEAVVRIGAASPGAAAALALHALELTGPGDPARPARTLAAAGRLAADGRPEQASELARSALAAPMPMPVPTAARLRCMLSRIRRVAGDPGEAVAAAETTLAEPALDDPLKDEALRCLLPVQDTVPVEPILASPGEHTGEVVAAALLRRAHEAWDAGRVREALHTAMEAVQAAGPGSVDGCAVPVRLIVAMMLNDIGRGDKARAVLADTQLPWSPFPALLRAGSHLASGRLRQARAEAETAVAGSRRLGNLLLASTATPLLAEATLRCGDVAAAAAHARDARSPGLPPSHGMLDLVRARLMEAESGPADAVAAYRPLWDDLPARQGVLIGDGAAAAWLVRTALAAGLPEAASAVARTAERLAHGDPETVHLSVAAAHARGLRDRDPSPLLWAAGRYPDPWAGATAAEDAGVLAGTRRGAGRNAAIEHLERALNGYEALGAARDEARVRGRLRKFGVRHRHWSTTDRPVSGWESLTGTELQVARLVAEGLTNRQAAERLFLSTHTVAFHLRQIFRKMDVSSRVELTRLTLERGG
ncbi:LuxR C-terminal-related transcriptional regulator [Spirillospora sp. CA-255316]